MTVCLMCGRALDTSKLTLEQRLIDDRDFCGRCWLDIMNAPYDGDLDYLKAIMEVKPTS